MSSRKEQKARARAQRLAREAKLRAAARRKRLILRASGAAARGIPLTTHAQIQLEVGAPLVAPDGIAFPAGL